MSKLVFKSELSKQDFNKSLKGVFMKNIIKFFGVIALAAIVGFSLLSCNLESKGGTFELVNDTGGTIYYRLSTSSSVNSVSTSLSNGYKSTLKLSEDGKVYYGWGYSLYGYIYSGVKEVSGGDTVTITAY